MAGFLALLKDMPRILYYMAYSSYLRYTLEAMVLAMYSFGRENLACDKHYCHYRSPLNVLDELDMRWVQLLEVCVWEVSEVQLNLLLSLVLVWVNVQMSLVLFVGIFSGDVMFHFAKEKYPSSVWLPSDSFLISCLTQSHYPTNRFHWLRICCISEGGHPIVPSNVYIFFLRNQPQKYVRVHRLSKLWS